MGHRLTAIAAYQREYLGASLYECIMAVADVSDLDNAELNELEDMLMNGDTYAKAVSQTYPKQGELV